MSKVVRYMLVIAGLVLSCEASSQDPGRWEQAVRAFASQETKSAAPANAILFVGSSSIVKWETLRQDMAPLTVINHGFGGSTMGDWFIGSNHWFSNTVLAR